MRELLKAVAAIALVASVAVLPRATVVVPSYFAAEKERLDTGRAASAEGRRDSRRAAGLDRPACPNEMQPRS